jgi:hypothetical protein
MQVSTRAELPIASSMKDPASSPATNSTRAAASSIEDILAISLIAILYRMLRSRDSFTRLNANFVIWERNRSLLVLLLIVTLIMLALVVIRIRR